MSGKRRTINAVARPTSTREAIVRHLYVHIPFCARICPYCAFYKERADPAQTQRFCEALLRELDVLGAIDSMLRPQTIFFGGGTPTALSRPINCEWCSAAFASGSI